MRVTTKARQAIDAMVDLTLQSRQGPAALSDICRRQRISISHLEQLFGKLRRAGLVTSSRGPGGGYMLALRAGAITAADIVRAVDDEPDPRDAFADAGERSGAGRIDVGSLWSASTARMFDSLAVVTLEALAREQEAIGVAIEPKARGLGRWGEPVPAWEKVDTPNSVFDFGDRSRKRAR